MSELICERCGQKIKATESWERDIHQVPFDPYESQYVNQVFGGFARHKGKCPNAPETEESKRQSPELQLLIIDLGDSCVVKVEKGSCHIPNLMLRDDERKCGSLFIIPRTFTELREAIEQKSVPRIDATYQCYRLWNISGLDTELHQRQMDAIEQLTGKRLPIWKGGEWEEIGVASAVTANDSGVRMYRYTR